MWKELSNNKTDMVKEAKTIHNHFEAGSNCQVFNGPISGCVFAMPGSHVTQQGASGQGATCSEEGTAEAVGDAEIPAPLATERAVLLMKRLESAGWVDGRWQPRGLSCSEQALTAKVVSERLGINDVWQVFGALWKVKPSTLRAYFNRALTQRKSLRFQDLLKEVIG